MSDQLREKRLRRMVRELNKERKLRAKKIDILCNDIIGTQRSFIRNFESVNFAANFYESIIGARELESLLHSVCATIKEQIDDSTIAFFLKSNNKFSMHLFERHSHAGKILRKLLHAGGNGKYFPVQRIMHLRTHARNGPGGKSEFIQKDFSRRYPALPQRLLIRVYSDLQKS